MKTKQDEDLFLVFEINIKLKKACRASCVAQFCPSIKTKMFFDLHLDSNKKFKKFFYQVLQFAPQIHLILKFYFEIKVKTKKILKIFSL